MKKFLTLALCVFALCAASYAQTDYSIPSPNSAKKDKANQTKKTSKAKTNKDAKTKLVQVDRGSQESTSERDSRLHRECKGRPNAGACAGYAS